MSRAQTQLDTWVTPTRRPQVNWDTLEPCVRRLSMDEKVHGIGHDWDDLTPAVRRLSKHEKLLGVSIIREERQERTTAGVTDDSVREDVRRATIDSHDYSDCGGGDHE